MATFLKQSDYEDWSGASMTTAEDDSGPSAENKGGSGDEDRSFLDFLREGPGKIVDWLGNNEVWIGGTMVQTDEGKFVLRHGMTPQESASSEKPGILSWWETMPNAVKFGVPAVALFVLLRK